MTTAGLWRALDAAGAMDAENAPTALSSCDDFKPLPLAGFSNVRQSGNRKSSENHCINTVGVSGLTHRWAWVDLNHRPRPYQYCGHCPARRVGRVEPDGRIHFY